METILLALLVVAGIAAAGFGAHYVRGLFYAGPRSFRYAEETFIWVPNEDGNRSFFRPHYESGSFQYADGTPVTDHSLHRMLQEHWLARNRPPEYL